MLRTTTKILIVLTAASGIATAASMIEDICISNDYAEEREQYLRDNDPNYKTAVIYE